MRSTFTGFNIASSGLFTAQRALDVTGHNISNVNTPGYSRQRLNQAQATPMSIYGGKGMLGTGVDSVSITQYRNEFLDFKYRSEVTTLGYWEAKSQGLQFIEAMFNEPSNTGIATVIDEMFASFQELSKTPESLTTRALVRQRAIAFTNTVNHMYNQMEKMVKDLNFDVNTTVATINGYAEQIADLNSQILRLENDGSHANDLRDRRNYLLDELSKLVNVDVVEMTDVNDKMTKKMVLQINGQPLVYHDRVNKLDASTQKASEFDDQVMVTEVRWANGDRIDTRALSGELKALLDLRDGMDGANKGVPYYIEQLNEFVRTFAEEINTVHYGGYGLDKQTDIYFFTNDGIKSEDYDPLALKLNAKNIKISYEIDTDRNAIAASSDPNLVPGDGEVALAILNLRHKSDMFSQGKPEDFIKSLVSNLGVDTQEAIRMTANQLFLAEQINNQRQAISGVSIDEEMANMVRFQHAYNAAARMVTTMDEMLDTIIHKVGIVGR